MTTATATENDFKQKKTIQQLVTDAGLGDDVMVVLNEMRQSMTLAQIGNFFGITGQRIGAFMHYYTKKPRAKCEPINFERVQFYTCQSCKKDKAAEVMRTHTECNLCAKHKRIARV